MSKPNAAEPAWLSEGLPHIWLPYAQMKTMTRPIAAKATRGARIVLEDGRELVDGISSWWTAVHGYNHPALLEAARAQLERMPHVMLGGLANEPAYRLAAKLAEIAPKDAARKLDRVFFSESGSVSVEAAMKMAIQYQAQTGHPERTRFVAFVDGYHGDTFGAMSACDPDTKMHAMFSGGMPHQHIVALPDTPEREAALGRLLASSGDIAGVMVEPLIQGAGGMKMHEAETLRAIRRICDAHGALMIADEIFSGLGRTGAMFACTAAGVVPDIMTLSKALTGGVAPLSATIAAKHVFDAFWSDDIDRRFTHGPTYSGHALGCAIALASLKLFEDESRLDQVKVLETKLEAGLRPLAALAQVADVRVKGAVGAVELRRLDDVEGMRRRFIEAGVFIRPIGRVVYLTPPYVIGDADLEHLLNAVAAEIVAAPA